MKIRFYNDKAYFTNKIKGQYIMARTACTILRYVENGQRYVLTIKERDKNIVEFPGGKVEVGDEDIYDTVFREIWEEIILKDNLGMDEGRFLKNWPNIRKEILNSPHIDQRICCKIYNSLRISQVVPYGSGALRNLYFIVDISTDDAKYLINSHNLVPVHVDIINHIVDYSNVKRGYGGPMTVFCNSTKGYHRKDTYFHTNNEIYKFRGRDFAGMFRFADLL